MERSKVSFPHPVLGNGDDISSGKISPDVSYEIRDESIRLSIDQLTTAHPDFDSLIVDGDAFWHFRIQCSRTYMRENFFSNDVAFEVRLNGDDYEGMVAVEVSIVTSKSIPKYRPSGIHDDYGDEVFRLCAGEVIGVGPTYSFHVDKIYDPLKAPVSSIMRITEGIHNDGPFSLTLDDDLIIVKLSKADWHEYDGVRDRMPTIIHSAIVFPALAEAITKIDENPDTIWAGRLKDQLEAKGIDRAFPLKAAQEILSSPVNRTFVDVNAALDRSYA